MRVAVLCKPESWYLSDLRRAAGPRHDVFPLSFGELSASVGNVRSIAGLPCGTPADVVLVRSMSPGSLEQVVFRMDLLGQWQADGVVVINNARAVEASVDKYLATAKLAAAGLEVPRTVVCQTALQAVAAFNALGGDVVIKPLFGGEGRGIARLTDDAVVEHACGLLVRAGAAIYMQAFVPHNGYDLRIFVLGSKLWGMRRSSQTDWRTNVSRGATAEPIEVDDSLAEIARRAAAAVGAEACGVDLLPARDGRLYALEVNAAPGWQALSRVTGVDIAAELLRYAADRARGRNA